MSTHTGRHSDDRGLRAYLEMLAGDSAGDAFLELRHRVRDQTLAAQFFGVGEMEQLVGAIGARSARTDVYVGCAPRARRAGTKDAVKEAWVVWAECDGTNAANAAHAFRPRPAMVVSSGSGPNLHAYWPLAAPVSPRDAEMANLRLANTLGADTQCFDAGRILRPPGTWNHKRQPPRPVAVLRHDPRTFEVEHVIANTMAVAVDIVDRRWQPRAGRDVNGDPLLRIPPDTYVRTLLGTTPGRDHKVRCPFHEDKHPSLHVYPTPERGWSCFSCGRGGTIYDLAAPLFGLGTRGREFLQVRALLEERFALQRSRDRGERAVMTRLLTVDEVAEQLGMTKEWVWAQARAGRIPHVQLGRYRRFREEAIERWLAELEERSRDLRESARRPA